MIYAQNFHFKQKLRKFSMNDSEIFLKNDHCYHWPFAHNK